MKEEVGSSKLSPPPVIAGIIRFGNFEVDRRAGELRRAGIKLRLSGQPFDVLVALLEKPGQVVTREELHDKLWSQDTFVDFEHGLNKAVNRVREALGDDADNPRFIETLPRRGYRFLAPVTPPPQAEVPAGDSALPVAVQIQATSLPTPSASHPERWWIWMTPFGALRWWPQVLISSAALILLVPGVWWLLANRTQSQKQLVQRQLTDNSTDDPVLAAAISPDGKFLAYSDANGLHLRLISTGETRSLALPSGLVAANIFSGAPETLGAPLSWFPDGSKVLITATRPGEDPSLWAISILGGAARKLRDGAAAASVSPDGSQIAFLGDYDSGTAQGIWVSTADGANQRHIMTAQHGEYFHQVTWSPDGQRLAYSKALAGAGIYVSAIESVSLKGGPPTRILSSTKLQGFCWLPDGRIVYSLRQSVMVGADSNLWEVRTITQTGEPAGEPRQLTNWPGFSFSGFTVTADGRQMEFLRLTAKAHVYVGELDAKGTGLNNTRRLTFDEHSEWPESWTPDGRAVVFWSDRDGRWDIFKQTLNEDSAAELLPLGPEPKYYSSFSPDGHWILYMALPEARFPGGSVPVRIMQVPASGGPPRLVLTALGTTDIHCTRAPANLCIFNEQQQDHFLFTSVDPMKGRGRALATMEMEPSMAIAWDLSPDGSRIAMAGLNPREGRIRLVSLKSGVVTDLVVKGWNSFGEVDWSADGKALYVSSGTSDGTTLLRISLDGEARALWHQKLNFMSTKGIPSPDGRHLAVAGYTTDSNVWLIENF